MEHVSNEEKAKKICENCMLRNKPFPKQLLEKELTHCDVCPSTSIALKAMRWKDEQHAQERQQLIDKVCEWIKDNINYYLDWYDWGKCMVNKGELIDDIRNAMKGE